jgi:two-component system, sporulation sensor kinase E
MNRSTQQLVIFALVAVVITIGSLIYSNHLARQLLDQEVNRMDLYAKALAFVGDLELDPENCELEWVTTNLIHQNEEIPTILVMDGQISSTNHLPIDSALTEADRKVEEIAYLQRLKRQGSPEPIVIPYYGKELMIYYDESSLLKQLRLYPYLMLLVIVVFISVVFGSFFIAKRNEQNKVWVGMAKETAHQLGTPVSSLMAWVELLELTSEEDPAKIELVEELKKDVNRLRTIAERFSKIGSVPELNETDLTDLLDRSADYLRKRMPKKVTLVLKNEVPEGETIKVNEALFEWVIENLLKNALDAIKEQGQITIHAYLKGKEYVIDVSDTGKGIPKSQFKEVFKPGFTTKKRGWGLGLSLSKRVVENYHRGRIFVLSSELGKGTTFRVILPA